MADTKRIDEINKELERPLLRPGRVMELLKELKQLGYYEANRRS